MPYILMGIFGIIIVASCLLPIKWIIEDNRASNNEKLVFILLIIPFWIFSYYLFQAWMSYSQPD